MRHPRKSNIYLPSVQLAHETERKLNERNLVHMKKQIIELFRIFTPPLVFIIICGSENFPMDIPPTYCDPEDRLLHTYIPIKSYRIASH
jgi:hypothetical protein